MSIYTFLQSLLYMFSQTGEAIKAVFIFAGAIVLFIVLLWLTRLASGIIRAYWRKMLDWKTGWVSRIFWTVVFLFLTFFPAYVFVPFLTASLSAAILAGRVTVEETTDLFAWLYVTLTFLINVLALVSETFANYRASRKVAAPPPEPE